MVERADGPFEGGALNVIRIAAGLLFMQHGAQKLFGGLGGMDGAGASAQLVSQMGLAGVIEFFGGLMIAIGLFTVPVALVACAEMVVAYVLVHFPQGFWPIGNGGELALVYASIWLYLAARGPGSLSVDAKLRGEGAAAEPAALRSPSPTSTQATAGPSSSGPSPSEGSGAPGTPTA